MLSKKELQVLSELVSKIENIKLCYLYGSSLKNDQFNDINIGIVVWNLQSSYQDLKFAMRIARELEKALSFKWELDVRILNHAPIYFQFEVVKQGFLLYSCHENERISYEENIVSSYLDFRDTLDWFDNQILRSA